MLIELLQGYKVKKNYFFLIFYFPLFFVSKDLCRRFEEALQVEQRAIQKATNQNKRPLTTNDLSQKVKILFFDLPVINIISNI
jgi:hypothetical protein